MKRLIATILSFVIILSLPSPYAQALTNGNSFYAENNILFFDEQGIDICTSTVSGNSNIEKVFSVFLGKGLSKEQISGVVGNFIVESGSDTINPAAKESKEENVGGHGIAQWTGSRWSGQDGLKSFAEFKGKEWTDLVTQLEFVLWEVGQADGWNGKAGGSEKAAWEALKKQVSASSAAESWMVTYERPGVENLERRIEAADKIFTEYRNKEISAGSIGCSADGPVKGDIVATAKNLAWDYYKTLSFSNEANHGKEDAKPSYVTEALKLTSNTSEAYFTDCGVFVATVLHSSGVDTSFPKRGTVNQIPYLNNSPKYNSFKVTSESQLQPGDILYTTGHIYIYTGKFTSSKDNKVYPAVGASLHTRPPSAHYFVTSGDYYAARYIGG